MMPTEMIIASWVLRVIGAYLVVGLLFAVWFVVGGVGRISPASRGTGWGFRVLILPGSAALWPVLVYELVASRGRGGVVVGRALTMDDVETAIDDVETADGSEAEQPGVGEARPIFEEPTTEKAERFVDPEAETDAGDDAERMRLTDRPGGGAGA